MATAYKTIKTKLPLTLRSMALYLSNKDTEFILFKPVRVSGWEFAAWHPKCAFLTIEFSSYRHCKVLVRLVFAVISEA